MIDIIEIIGLGLCVVGIAAYVFYHIDLGIDTHHED
jgi:hypothetical protein